MLKNNIPKYFNGFTRLHQIAVHRSTSAAEDTQIENVEEKDTKQTPLQYLTSKKSLSNYKDLIPDEYLCKSSSPDTLYLIDPYIAKTIHSTISPYLSINNDKVIAECNPGLGLLTRKLLKNQNGLLKLFEPSKPFRTLLKEKVVKKTDRIQLYSKNLLKLNSYEYCDKLDNGQRVNTLLKATPKKAWNSDPALSIITPMLNTSFLSHLFSAIPSQSSLISYGRVEIFAIMKPSLYWALSTEKDLFKFKYNSATILFNLYFDYEILCKLPRETFLPWDRFGKKRKRKLDLIDRDKLYLVHIVTKKDFALPMEQLSDFNYFLRKFYHKKSGVISTLEFCVPNCGAHVIIPRQHHESYCENINIFTHFKDLMPTQIWEVFKEMYHHPNYVGSPLMEMMKADFEKTGSYEYSYAAGEEVNFMDEMELELDHFPDDIN